MDILTDLLTYLVFSLSRNSSRFMAPERSSPHSIVPATCPFLHRKTYKVAKVSFSSYAIITLTCLCSWASVLRYRPLGNLLHLQGTFIYTFNRRKQKVPPKHSPRLQNKWRHKFAFELLNSRSNSRLDQYCNVWKEGDWLTFGFCLVLSNLAIL
jgi:hypothetical protein